RHPEGEPFVAVGATRDPTPVRRDDPLCDKEANAEAEATRPPKAVSVCGTTKGLQDARQRIGGDRRAAVPHLENGVAAGPRDANRDASGAVDDRVRDQVRYDLREPIRIPHTGDRLLAVD